MKFSPAFLAAALLFGACSSEVTVNAKRQTLQSTLSECETQLAAKAYQLAFEAAAEVVEDQPGLLSLPYVEADQLRFCYVTAQTLHKVDTLSAEINRIVTILDEWFSGEADVNAAARGFQPAAQPFDVFLENLLEPTVLLLESNRRQYEAILLNRRFHWKIDRLPVVIAEEELFDAQGEYDIGEVQVLLSLTNLMLANLRMFQSNNYTIALGPVINYALLDDSPLKNFNDRPVAAIMNSVAVLLATHSEFLALKEDTGAALVAQAGDEFSASAKNLLDALTFMTTERKGDQAKHIFEYRKDGVDDYVIVHLQFKHELVDELELAKFDDLSIPLRSEVIQGLANIEASLAAGGGVRANLQTDIFPLIALAGVVILNTGALDELLEEALATLETPVANKVRTAIELTNSQETYFLAQLLTAVPAQIEIDLGRFFAEPKGLRDLLPAWNQPVTAPAGTTAAMAAFTATTFVYAYECADPLQNSENRVVCDNPVDSAHFSEVLNNDPLYKNLGADWPGEIGEDGIKSPFAYIGFKDPTFNGTFYVDVTNLNSPALYNEEGMALASQRTLNAAIASTAQIVNGLLSE